MSATVRIALALAVISISFAGPFFRMAEPTPPLVSSGLRLAMASVLLAPLVLRAWRAGRLPAAHRRAGVIAGLLYGVHFGAWVWSLTLTSITASVTLVTATPVLLAIVGLATRRDPASRRLWLAIGVATLGVLIIGGSHLTADPQALLGDALAFLGAAAMAGYMLVVRRLDAPDPLAFTGLAALIGAIALLGTAALLGLPLAAASPEAWLYLGLAALIPQLVGHTLLTWSLRHATPATVGMATVGEPVGSTLIALAWWGEIVGWQVAIGCAVTLAGVVTALSAGRQLRSPP